MPPEKPGPGTKKHVEKLFRNILFVGVISQLFCIIHSSTPQNISSPWSPYIPGQLFHSSQRHHLVASHTNTVVSFIKTFLLDDPYL
ncbi:hypothetical protein XELAEV_18008100mg [Xenopus laevis]|uniref:Uncharacterized protein n=1 Tax=Xenopus laevis TaxID=8355 RepID=A0A974E456_XENLA|nr:hypothetical protein XELAEV_18008100mg [Xenopus laevis]